MRYKEISARYSEQPSSEESLKQIERLSKSDALRNSETLRKLLVFLAQHTLDSPETPPKEYEIALDALGYAADFDSQSNSAVRVQVSRLRSKLLEYYNSAGAQDAIVVDMPKGGYTLSFRWRDSIAEQESSKETAAEDGQEELAVVWSSPPRQKRLVVPVLWGLLLLSWIALAAVLILLRYQQDRLTPWRNQPNLAEFWSNFFGQSENTDIVLADNSFLLFETIAGRTYPLNAYSDRSFTRDVSAKSLSHDVKNTLSIITKKNFGNSDEFQLAQRISTIDPFEAPNLYNARDYSAASLERTNAILIGSPVANPWTALFNEQLTFTLESQPVNSSIETEILNHAPSSNERGIYKPESVTPNGMQIGYCIIAFLPTPRRNRKVLLIEGTTSEANEAASNLLLSETQLAMLKNRMHVTRFPYFEVLLKTAQMRSMPFSYSIEAYRTYGESEP